MPVLLGVGSGFAAAFGLRTVAEAGGEFEVAVGMALIAAAASAILVMMRRTARRKQSALGDS